MTEIIVLPAKGGQAVNRLCLPLPRKRRLPGRDGEK